MSFALGPKALAAGYRLATFETIGSTSTEALALGTLGDPGRIWVVAGEQTAGHGRRGRSWETRRGNLAASLLLVQPQGSAASATLGFVAGLALNEAICTTLRQNQLPERVSLCLKWPNDVLCNGAKLAGILLEAATRPGVGSNVVVGIGVNVRHAPTGMPYPVTSLAEHGLMIPAETLFTALGETWVEQEALWDEGRGFAAIRGEWLRHAAGLGALIAVSVSGDVYRGVFETIDDDGRLIVRATDGSSRAVSAGEVYFGATTTAVS